MSTGYGHTIHQSAEENCCVGKSSKILCVKTKNGKESLCVRMHSNGEDVNLQKKIAWVKPKKIPVHKNSEQPNGKCVKVNSYQEDANLQCVGAQQLVELRKCLRETQSTQSLCVKRIRQWR